MAATGVAWWFSAGGWLVLPGGSKTAALTHPAPWPSPLRAFPMSLQQRCLASSPWLSGPAQKLPLKGLTWNLYTPLPPFSLLRATTDQPTLKRRANRLCTSSSVQFSSVAQSCPTLCDPMDCSISDLLVHHHLPELTQTHVHRVGDAIQPSHTPVIKGRSLKKNKPVLISKVK